MSTTKALHAGLSGITAHGTALGVVGDNIANLNTSGYKAERAIFADLLGHSMAHRDRSGAGVRLQGISRDFDQGAHLSTTSSTDLSISGRGFFIVRGAVGGPPGDHYTRDGAFTLNARGVMVNSAGLAVQGYAVDSEEALDHRLTDLRVSPAELAPSETTRVTISANLDASAPLSPGGAFDPDNPGETSNFSTAITVYDSLGTPHRVDIFFRKAQEADPATPSLAEWEYHALADGSELGGTPGALVEMAAGRLAFTADGLLASETATLEWNAIPPGTTPPFTGAAGQAVALDFGQSLSEGGLDPTSTTNHASSNTVRGQQWDGASAGTLIDVAVQDSGEVVAVYSNGESRPVGRVALATFESAGALSRSGNSLWVATERSGQARIGPAGAGVAGTIVSESLEQSTVDLGDELVKLMAYQRGFQANARTISSVAQLYAQSRIGS